MLIYRGHKVDIKLKEYRCPNRHITRIRKYKGTVEIELQHQKIKRFSLNQ